MTICRFYQQGHCKFGANCRFEHPQKGGQQTNSNRSHDQPHYQSQNQGQRRNAFDALDSRNDYNRGNARNAQPRNNSTLPREASNYRLDPRIIEDDLRLERPQWIASAYGPGMDAPEQLFGGLMEQSPEEIRTLHYLAKLAGNPQQSAQTEQELLTESNKKVELALDDLNGAIRYILDGLKKHPNRSDVCKQFAPQRSTGEFSRDRQQQRHRQLQRENRSANERPSGPFRNAPFGQVQQQQASGFASVESPQDLSMKSSPTPFGQQQAPFGQQQAPFGQQQAPFGQQQVPFGQTPAFGGGQQPDFSNNLQMGLQAQPAPFGQAQQPTPFGLQQQQSAPFGQQAQQPSNGFGQPQVQQSPFGQSNGQVQNSIGFDTQHQNQPFGRSSGFTNGMPSSQAPVTGSFDPVPNNVNIPNGANNAFNATPIAAVQDTNTGQANVPAFANNGFGSGANTSQTQTLPNNNIAVNESNGVQAANQVHQVTSVAPTSAPEATLTRAANGTDFWQGQKVTWQNNIPFVENSDRSLRRIWFPNGAPVQRLDEYADATAYPEAVKDAYLAFQQTGMFKDGIMPEMPPRPEWNRWNI